MINGALNVVDDTSDKLVPPQPIEPMNGGCVTKNMDTSGTAKDSDTSPAEEDKTSRTEVQLTGKRARCIQI